MPILGSFVRNKLLQQYTRTHQRKEAPNRSAKPPPLFTSRLLPNTPPRPTETFQLTHPPPQPKTIPLLPQRRLRPSPLGSFQLLQLGVAQMALSFRHNLRHSFQLIQPSIARTTLPFRHKPQDRFRLRHALVNCFARRANDVPFAVGAVAPFCFATRGIWVEQLCGAVDPLELEVRSARAQGGRFAAAAVARAAFDYAALVAVQGEVDVGAHAGVGVAAGWDAGCAGFAVCGGVFEEAAGWEGVRSRRWGGVGWRGQAAGWCEVGVLFWWLQLGRGAHVAWDRVFGFVRV
jgi:hypothetical protein